MPVTTADEAIELVRKLSKKLNAQASDASKWQKYYEGDQPLKFASGEWSEHFAKQYEGFADNWCAPVVDATAERQKWVGFRQYEAKSDDRELGRIMSINNADVEFELAATEAQYARRAFGHVWGNPDDDTTPEVTFESPTQVVVEYEPGSRRRLTSALKRWKSDDGVTYATLYTPENLWKFRSGRAQSSFWIPTGMTGDWVPRFDDDVWPLPNPMKRVPFVELANRTTLVGQPLSAIAGVASMQDAINLLWSHLFTASDFAALPQRVLLAAEIPSVPVLDEAGQEVGRKAVDMAEANVKRIMAFNGPNAKIAEWTAADLKKFLEVITMAVGHIANQTRTPAYYLAGGTTFANISGDTIKALDAGLVAKVNGLNDVMSAPMRELGQMIYMAKGDGKAAAAMSAGVVHWGDTEIRSDAQLADSLTKLKSIGFPFEYLAGRVIDDPDELKTVLEQYEKEQRDSTLENMMRRFEADEEMPADAEGDVEPVE